MSTARCVELDPLVKGHLLSSDAGRGGWSTDGPSTQPDPCGAVAERKTLPNVPESSQLARVYFTKFKGLLRKRLPVGGTGDAKGGKCIRAVSLPLLFEVEISGAVCHRSRCHVCSAPKPRKRSSSAALVGSRRFADVQRFWKFRLLELCRRSVLLAHVKGQRV
ncbi:hypothetical protein F2P81_024943 [Scophthalmus maximus]|uniref:Uncharacterized protein n=1 Tax=Scophthalmus maximus TaxID=52904 RepID=A0A6A4RV72_SCOMX|nr:hypothetical protein F2P81_024943 [Scophthalmus maximus]